MIVVTGAGLGIGAGVTAQLASSGCQVLALDRQWDGDNSPREVGGFSTTSFRSSQASRAPSTLTTGCSRFGD